MRQIGVDIGSLFLGSVALENGRVADSRYVEHRGDVNAELKRLFANRLTKTMALSA